MKILISSASHLFSDHIPGGELQIAHGIVSRLAERGHELHVIAPRVRLKSPIPRVSTYEVGCVDFTVTRKYWAYRLGWWDFSIRSWRLARQLIQRLNIDIVHHIRPAFRGKFSLNPYLSRPFVYGPLSLPWAGSATDGARWAKPNLADQLLNKFSDRLDFTLGE